MKDGLLAGVLWALDTVLLGLVLSRMTFPGQEQLIWMAPLISTFLHDLFSSLWMLLYMGVRKQLSQVRRALGTKSGRFIILGALLGGPIGMSGYVAAIQWIGPGYTSIISALFPAVGAIMSYIFLKEKLSALQWGGLVVSVGGVIALGYTPGGALSSNAWMGFVAAIVCCLGWASEAVICAYGLRDPDITDDQALQIRQTTSALFYGIVIISLLRAWPITINTVRQPGIWLLVVAALVGTMSYLFYYRAIAKIGATKAMALNITYTAWSVIFAIFFLHTLPDVKTVICGILIVLGSLVAAAGKALWQKEEA